MSIPTQSIPGIKVVPVQVSLHSWGILHHIPAAALGEVNLNQHSLGWNDSCGN